MSDSEERAALFYELYRANREGLKDLEPDRYWEFPRDPTCWKEINPRNRVALALTFEALAELDTLGAPR